MLGLLDGLLLGLVDGLLLGLLLGLGDVDELLLGLGLELADGLGLLDALLDGLGLVDGLLLADRLALGELAARWLCPPVSRFADIAEAVPRAHGDPAGCAGEASAGAIASPVARKVPAAMAVATFQDLAILTGTTTLPRAVRLRPYLRA